MLYEDYKFTRQYLETQYDAAVQQTQEATSNYNVAVNERDTASKADQPSYDDKVSSASQQLDYAKDTERAASNDLMQLKIDPALRDNAKQYEAEKAGQDPSKEWSTRHDNDAKPEQPNPLQNFAMQAGVVGVMGMQALTSSPSAHSIQSELQQDALLAAKVESQFQSGSQQPGSQQQQQQQPASDQKGPETSGPGKDGTGKPADPHATEQHPQGSQQQQHGGDQKGPETTGPGKEGAEKPAGHHAPEHHPQGSEQQQQHHDHHHNQHHDQSQEQHQAQHHEQHHEQHPGSDQKASETHGPGKEGTEKPADQHAPQEHAPHPTEQATAGPSEKEIKQEEKEHQKDERSEQAAENVEQLHHGLEQTEKSLDSGKTGVHSGSADFGAPGYPDPERSSAMAASLQSPHGESHQTAPAQGGAELPPTERPVEPQAKGEAQVSAQAHPDPEHSAAAAAQTSEPKGHAQEPAAQGHAPSNQAPEAKGAAHETAPPHETAPAHGHAESAGQGQSNHQPQGQSDHQVHQTELHGEASFGAHNYPNPEREQQTATSLSSPGGGGGQGAAEHSSATYNVTNGAQPREMPPAEHSASQIANTEQPPKQPEDPNHGH